MQALRTTTLLNRLQHRFISAKFLRTPCFTEQFQWLLQTVLGFQSVSLLKRRLRQRCFSVNFGKFLRISLDCFLCLTVKFEKFFRTPLLYSTSGKLLILCTSCRISTTRYNKNYFTGAFQAFYTRTRSSHSKAFIYLKSLKIICEEVNL